MLASLGEQIGDLALALVAPLGPDYDHAWHRGILTVRRGGALAEARWASAWRWVLAVAAVLAEQRSTSSHISLSRETVRAPICSSSSLVGSRLVVTSIERCGLVALVDQRVELLQHPVGAFLGAEVVDVEQVDRGQPLEEGEVGVAARLGVVGAADPRQQLRQRVDRDRLAGFQRRLGDQHRQRRLAGPGVAEEPEAAAFGEARVEIVDEVRAPRTTAILVSRSRAMSETGGRSKETPR